MESNVDLVVYNARKTLEEQNGRRTGWISYEIHISIHIHVSQRSRNNGHYAI